MLIDFHLHVSRREHSRSWVLEFIQAQSGEGDVWAVLEPLLPKQKPGPGRNRLDNRKVLNGILYVLKTGCAWADVPQGYGSPTTCWRRL